MKLDRRTEPDLVGKEIFEVHPIILGGNPTDPQNKIVLNREEHIKAVNYWNNIIKGAKGSVLDARKRET